MSKLVLFQSQKGLCVQCTKPLVELGNLHDGELLCQLCYHPIWRAENWDEEYNEPKWVVEKMKNEV